MKPLSGLRTVMPELPFRNGEAPAPKRLAISGAAAAAEVSSLLQFRLPAPLSHACLRQRERPMMRSGGRFRHVRHIAIVGSGPAGYYTAEAALKQWGDRKSTRLNSSN